MENWDDEDDWEKQHIELLETYIDKKFAACQQLIEGTVVTDINVDSSGDWHILFSNGARFDSFSMQNGFERSFLTISSDKIKGDKRIMLSEIIL